MIINKKKLKMYISNTRGEQGELESSEYKLSHLFYWESITLPNIDKLVNIYIIYIYRLYIVSLFILYYMLYILIYIYILYIFSPFILYTYIISLFSNTNSVAMNIHVHISLNVCKRIFTQLKVELLLGCRLY